MCQNMLPQIVGRKRGMAGRQACTPLSFYSSLSSHFALFKFVSLSHLLSLFHPQRHHVIKVVSIRTSNLSRKKLAPNLNATSKGHKSTFYLRRSRKVYDCRFVFFFVLFCPLRTLLMACPEAEYTLYTEEI